MSKGIRYGYGPESKCWTCRDVLKCPWPEEEIPGMIATVVGISQSRRILKRVMHCPNYIKGELE